ncbi:uncharacterized protein LOC111604954 isoform X2 [Drosophila hydei]|uniref:Uncharacterized protein LOC111604954 isoform X2 n=1 Tax=Drosophila hydei TaxID=7224 RepID=A0A6J2SUS1_DROHY|nr:uncharacterized protein LOC111604954 isoform X2 [Drosophila hydei]
MSGLKMQDLRALNNCEAFKQLRSGLTYYHTNVKPLHSFNYVSGNEQQIKNVAQIVLQVLLEHELVIEEKHSIKAEQKQQVKVNAAGDIDKLRGTLMYLLLNSSMGNKEKEMELAAWNPQFVHLLKQLPEPLTQLVTVSVALICGLQEFLFEFLAYAPTWLTAQYFDCLNNVLNHLVDNKMEALPYIGGALNAVTNAICYRYSMPIIDNSLALLQRHLLFNEERLRSFLPSSGRRNRYLGKAMCMLLDVLIKILSSLQELPEPPNYISIYELHSSPMKSVNDLLPTTQQQLQIFGNKLMDVVQLLLQQISVDTYMSWQEFPSDQLLFHLQAQVCNRCLKVTQLLAAGQQEQELLFNHSLNSQLTNFIDGAQSFEQCLAALSLGELLSLLDGESGKVDDEQLAKALDELLSRSICFGNAECVESLAKHKRFLNAKHLEIMLEHLGQVVQLQKAEDDDKKQEEDEQMEQTQESPVQVKREHEEEVHVSSAPKANEKLQKQKKDQEHERKEQNSEPEPKKDKLDDVAEQPNEADQKQQPMKQSVKQPAPELMEADSAQPSEQKQQKHVTNGSKPKLEAEDEEMELDTVSNASLANAEEQDEGDNDEDEDEDEDDDDDDEEEDMNAPYGELIHSLLLPIYQSITNAQQKLHLLEKRDQLQVLERFSFVLPQYVARRIYFYNQLSYCNESFPMNTFLDLCFEQPHETWLAFAQLAMKHSRFASLYLRIIKRCMPHSMYYLEATVQSLFNDAQLLCSCSNSRYATASSELLLRLYEQPILLQSGSMPLPALMLQQQKLPFKQSQERFLADLSSAMATYTTARNYAAVEKTLLILLQLDAVEQQLLKGARDKLKAKRSQLNRLMQSKSKTSGKSHSNVTKDIRRARQQLQLAKAQIIMHNSFNNNRSCNWQLVSQIVLSMDQLRDKLEHFHLTRIAALDLTMKYYIKYVARAITGNAELRGCLRSLIAQKVKHKDLWRDEQLLLLMEEKRSVSEYTRLLSHSSTVESIQLLRSSIRHHLDAAVLQSIAEHVNKLGSAKAHHAYSFIFKCYMQVLNRELIDHAKPSDYPRLIEHILRTPNIRKPENLLAAIPNLKILLRPSGITSKSLILQYVSQTLALTPH